MFGFSIVKNNGEPLHHFGTLYDKEVKFMLNVYDRMIRAGRHHLEACLEATDLTMEEFDIRRDSRPAMNQQLLDSLWKRAIKKIDNDTLRGHINRLEGLGYYVESTPMVLGRAALGQQYWLYDKDGKEKYTYPFISKAAAWMRLLSEEQFELALHGKPSLVS